MPTRLPAARRRRQLLEVALRVFAEQGFYVTSMSDIADAAGVTKPVLYQHFASKRELYGQILAEVGNQLQEAIVSHTVIDHIRTAPEEALVTARSSGPV